MLRTLVRRLLPWAFPLGYAFALDLGRSLRMADSEIALAWPAAAVSSLWYLSIYDRSLIVRGTHLMLIGAITFAITMATDSSVSLALWFTLVNLALPTVTIGLLRRRRSRAHLVDPADLTRLLLAVLAGSLTAAVMATGYFAVRGDEGLVGMFTLFAVRNGVTAFAGIALGLRLEAGSWQWSLPSVSRAIEAAATTLAVVAVLLVLFWFNPGLPVAFVAFLPAMWVALRWSTTASTVALVIAGAWIVTATLAGHGPFMVGTLMERALSAQAMVGSLTLTMLALSLFRDSRNTLVATLRHRALTDDLTGLANRARLLRLTEEALRTGPAGMLFIDLDGFKAVNDRYGHAWGDQVLRTIADRLTATTGPGPLVARLGGDEFAVLCPGVSDPTTLAPLAMRLLAAVEAPYPALPAEGGDPVGITASIGVATAPPLSGSDELLSTADELMYVAKRHGKNQYRAAAPTQALPAG